MIPNISRRKQSLIITVIEHEQRYIEKKEKGDISKKRSYPQYYMKLKSKHHSEKKEENARVHRQESTLVT